MLDSGFCVLLSLVELRKRGLFSGDLIKSRYWPKDVQGDVIKLHFDTEEVGATDSWGDYGRTIPHILNEGD